MSKILTPELIVNNSRRIQKVLTTLLEEFNSSTYFDISVAFITQSGVACLIETLSRLEVKGVKGRFLTGQYLNFTQPHALERLINFSNLEVRMDIQNSFHSKGYLFHQKDGSKNLYIGSSNLTQNALTTNIELNLGLKGFTDDDPFLTCYLRDFEDQWNGAAVVDQ